MGLNWKQFELGVLRRQLALLETKFFIRATPKSVMLVGETIAHESGSLSWLGQVPNDDDPDGFGPGLGIGSVEQKTWDWMKTDSTPIVERILAPYQYDDLIGNLNLNVIAVRCRYWLAKPELPELTAGMDARATFWWQNYNGSKIDFRPQYRQHAKLIPWAKT